MFTCWLNQPSSDGLTCLASGTEGCQQGKVVEQQDASEKQVGLKWQVEEVNSTYNPLRIEPLNQRI